MDQPHGGVLGLLAGREVAEAIILGHFDGVKAGLGAATGRLRLIGQISRTVKIQKDRYCPINYSF